MKNLLFYGLILAFLSCSTDRSKNENSDIKADEITEMNNKNDAAGDQKRVSNQDVKKFKSVNADVANQIVEGYLKLKDALVNTNGEEAKRIAKQMQQDIRSAGGEGVEVIRDDIEHIAETESVEHQREHFNQLSRNVYALAKASDAINKKLHRQYCPMAFNNTGAFWLSSSEEIRNPYFGDRMLKCGKVEETI